MQKGPLQKQISLKVSSRNDGYFSGLIFHLQKHALNGRHNYYIIFQSYAHLCRSVSSLHPQFHRQNSASHSVNQIYLQTGTKEHYTVCSSKLLTSYCPDTLLNKVSLCLYAG